MINFEPYSSKVNTSQNELPTTKIDNLEIGKMDITEIIIIFFILALWFLMVRKFIKKFETIRTTHYREIPYSYHQKNLSDQNRIKIIKQEQESMIHISPLKISRKSIGPLIVEKNENELSFDNNDVILTRNNSFSLDNINKLSVQNLSSIIKYNSSPRIVRQIAYNDEYIDRLSIGTDGTKHGSMNNLIDPLKIPSIVRRSLLDLHRGIEKQTNYRQKMKQNDRTKSDHLLKTESPV
jgi:hypothetical protein